MVPLPREVATPQIGTLIRVIVDMPENCAKDPRAPRVFWVTHLAPEVVPYRRRLALRRQLPGAPEGWQRVSLEIDLSWEPAWLVPRAHPGPLRIHAENAHEWKAIRIEFADGPLLSPRIEPKP
jgi:hypothetical protein